MRFALIFALSAAAVAAEEIDPAAWGEDHVGQAVPMYEDGNSCLFCHRYHVGDWQTNQHQITMQLPDDDAPEGASYMLGVGDHKRYLKRGEGYGKLDLYVKDVWDSKVFGANCVGCHASGVDSQEQFFTSIALDCHTCHGIVPAAHTEQGSLALFSKLEKTEARVETSICASCHLRGGESKSTGLPFPNNFVPGDNLFKDFQVDLSEEHIASMSDLGDRHIYENVRDVAVLGKKEVTCTTCHDVHGQSSGKHERVKRSARCFTCHNEAGPALETKEFERTSATCRY